MHLGCLTNVLLYHSHAIKSALLASIFTSNQLIHFYAKHGSLPRARQLFDEMPDRNVYTWNTIISAYLKFRDITSAELLFHSSPHKDLVTYNSMLSGYVSSNDGYDVNVLELFTEMHASRSNNGGVDEFTVTTMLGFVARLSLSSLGMQLHCFMVKTGNDSSRFASSSLIDMYSKCGYFQEAFRVFTNFEHGLDLVSKNAMVAACCRENELGLGLDIFWREPQLNDCVSWNTIISGFTQNGFHMKALNLIVCMLENGIMLNDHTFASVISACTGIRSLKLGKEVHAHVMKGGLIENPYISSGIVDLYCKCGDINYAKASYTTFSTGNAFSITSMIVAYSSMGDMVEARRLFDTLSEKNSVVWTALFTGYVKSQHCEAAFDLLRELLAKDAKILDALILMTLLGACAVQASLRLGKQTHAYLLRIGVKMDEKLLNAEIDMYSKCGHLTYAKRIFSGITERDAVLYNVMIAGYAHHGHGIEAITLFEEMCERRIKPNAATFIALLSNCRHVGLVDLGEKYFYAMEGEYGVKPEVDHYACMIDLYGRAGQLEKVVEFMKNITIEVDGVVLGAFLNACRINGNVGLAREVEEVMLSIEGESGSRYVQLANVYATQGKWDEVGRIRKTMKGKEVKKLAGCSWVNLDNESTIFTCGDKGHLRSNAIYSMLHFIYAEISMNDD
ncbi:hypothetical protein RND81_11G173300 [Saponaria officinalis]|uniref:Pentatricopeptide repeat-containing protein n=1 Tax=Saponaria officinalis TaxID=3572 RepID=A0AAW1HND4_SAPOF